MGMTSTTELVEAALRHVAAEYADEGTAAAMAARVRGRLATGAYDRLDGPALCRAVTADFRQAAADRHPRLLWRAEPRRPAAGHTAAGETGAERAPESTEAAARADSTEHEDFFAAVARAENQGIRRVERLDGNIGYIETTLLAEPDAAAPFIDAAMTLLAHTDALIVDLRANRGGSARGMAYWCRHLLPGGESARHPARRVYVLTGPATFSSAEDLAHQLKARGHAVLVGETTRGRAHPTGYYPLTEQVTIAVPLTRPLDPRTGAARTGLGITPDLPVPAEDAFHVAYQHALKKLPPRPALVGK